MSKHHSIHACALPAGALLQRYLRDGHYTDCFAVNFPGDVSLEKFVFAFYTGRVFRLERQILKWIAAKPSTDDDARGIATGAREDFAAWDLEARQQNQLLMTDFRGKTRSWFMVHALPDGLTRLYFGSAVIAGSSRPSLAFRLLMPLHRHYSRILLGGARRALRGSAFS